MICSLQHRNSFYNSQPPIGKTREEEGNEGEQEEENETED